MAKWKELGEVPDSDDESDFDSQELFQEELPLPNLNSNDGDGGKDDARDEPRKVGQLVDRAADRDVWDIPPSSSSSSQPDQVNDVAIPSSSLEPPPDSTPPGPRLSSPVPPPDEVVDAPIHLPQSQERHEQISAEPEESTSSVTADIDNQFVDAISDILSVPQELQGSTQEPIRYNRSLRPRKPIQEHPYLLESAQYSKILKSHGVRPVRVQMEEAARRRQEEEDSQEQDYEDDSQSTAKDPVLEESGESQVINQPDPFGDIDELALSPPRRPAPSPRIAARAEDLLRSSQDDDEFPDLADIDKWKTLRASKNSSKRHASPKMSAKRKVPKPRQPANPTNAASPLRHTLDLFDIPPSPPQTSPALFSTTPMSHNSRPRATTTLTPKPSSVISSRNESPAPANRTSRIIDLTMQDDHDDETDEGGESPSSSSENESDALLQNSRRIRGVLPASWLRLDQQAPRLTPKNINPRRSLDRSPDRSHRKGVAQRRQVSPKPTMDAPFFFNDTDDDDNDVTTLRLDETNDIPNNSTFSIFEDDAGSVVEEDHIDRMLPGTKRRSNETDGQERPKKKKKGQQSTFAGQPVQRKRQQRITGLLGRTKSTASTGHSRKNSHGAARQTKGRTATTIRPSTPPRLSILDVAEPDAPAFIRVAARAARRRPDKGRASPSTKRISLATRKDHLDATGVLRDWRQGKIKPRSSPDTISIERQANHAAPLQPVPHNSVVQKPRPGKPRVRRVIPSSRFSRTTGLAKQTSMDNFVSVEADIAPEPIDYVGLTRSPPRRVAPERDRRRNFESTSRPAQLEAAGESVGRYAFSVRKKALDALYRKSRKPLPAPTNLHLERVLENNAPASDTQESYDDASFMEALGAAEPAPRRTRLKSRKRTKPQRLDTSAPQYAHANDPLPQEESPVVEITAVSEINTKLLGLGPFGTHYTQHFEVFPLDSEVFFHESTLLGSGRVAKALESSLDSLNHHRGRSMFVLDEKNLQWGSWDGQTSSELGIVCDWIVDRLSSDSSPEESPKSAVRAASFILEYLQDSLTFPDQPSQKAFVHRILEVLQSYSQRLEALPSNSDRSSQSVIQVLCCYILTIYQALRICQKLAMLSETFRLEELLKKVAKHTSKRLLQTNLADIRSLYDDLQRASYRERGIRGDQASAICWVVLIRVLEEARIPRSGFWDIVSPIILGPDVNTIVDAHAFEHLWHSLFTLLPLGEFDNTGVVTPGIRHSIPLEGWGLPQKLLNRIFQLYKSNSRQSPSFNDYCRGIVARCHYLVEHWGWRKCNGMIGTIFDFFASQDLSHLRNEEVYRSPQFLEDLAASPSLAILPEDRCFHIFLKLLALSIKRLRELGLINDVRNLAARVLPNHDRHYVKEKDMHETELAALRNHHDLLCTLFWAAPPDLRPSIQLIEKLVVPGSSHKEACLVNLRAWNQLARFIVSSGEDISAYKPFAEWLRNVFQQVLDQYSSAESDIQQQFLRLSKDPTRNISQELMNSVVKANKKASMDVLHFSMKAILDVMRHTPTLAAASFVLNNYQLDQIFLGCSSTPGEPDWGSLRVAVDIVDYYTRRIDEFFSRQRVQTDADDSWHGEDAILLLEHKIATPFLSMTRGIVRIDFTQSLRGSAMDRIACLEEIILVAGRVAARLIHARLAGVRKFFSSGNFCIFEGLPKDIAAPSRKFLPLFLATLIDRGVVDFKDIGATTFELFLGAITKPFQYLAYENRLAEAMKRHDDPYLIDAFIDVGKSPDYNSNRDLFSYTVSRMRKALRFAEPRQKQQLQAQFSRTLRAVMEQIKQDLKLMVSSPPEHANYIDFIRSIVAIIRTQDICPIDPYFYQISPEYSPSRQDPRLQTAGILACGLKLEEGNANAAFSLFYLLWPNFTTALANGKLADEQSILEQGMQHPRVFSFMLGKMLPAIIRTAVRKSEGWVLIQTYVGALEKWMDGFAIHKEIDDENMDNVLTILKFIEAGVRHLQGLDISDLHTEHLYTLVQMFKLLNILRPSINAYLINDATSRTAEEITRIAIALADFAQTAGSYISSLLGDNKSHETSTATAAGSSDQQYPFTLDPARLFEGMPTPSSLQPGPNTNPPTAEDRNSEKNIDAFSAHMLREIGNGWTTTTTTTNGTASAMLTVKGPAARAPPRSTAPSSSSNVPATQSGLGTPVPRWDARTLVGQLRGQISAWERAFSDRDKKMEETRWGIGGGIRKGKGRERGKGRGAWESKWGGVVDCLF